MVYEKMSKEAFESQILECKRCGHHWIPQSKGTIPVICPYCKSSYWNKDKVRGVSE